MSTAGNAVVGRRWSMALGLRSPNISDQNIRQGKMKRKRFWPRRELNFRPSAQQVAALQLGYRGFCMSLVVNIFDMISKTWILLCFPLNKVLIPESARPRNIPGCAPVQHASLTMLVSSLRCRWR